jgi:hypothetical protein
VEIAELKEITNLVLSGNQLTGQHFFIFDSTHEGKIDPPN